MFFRAIFFSALALTTANLVDDGSIQNPRPRIEGGTEILIETAPHHVLLQFPNSKLCSGSIISKDWVITAAQCMMYPADKITVWAGTATKLSGGSTHRVQRIFAYENHTKNEYGMPLNDLAVLKVSTPFQLDDTRKAIKLFKKNEESIAGTEATVTGWGPLNSDENLRAITVTVVSKTTCNEKYQAFGGVQDEQICAGDHQAKMSVCYGDEGSPLTVNGRLAGFASWSYGCANPEYPGIFTKTASYIDWITAITEVAP